MPMPRVPGCIAACALVALASGCDAVGSFESVCEKRLPATHIAVTTQPVEYRVDRSLSYATLTRKGAAIATDGKTVLGLTEATLAYSVTAAGRGMSSRLTGRYCMRPSLDVALTFTPMTVYMGADEREGSCMDRVTWEHELRHVAVYQAFLPEFAARVNAQLRERFGNKVQHFASADEGQKHLDALLKDVLAPMVQAGMAEVKSRQRTVDSAEEYARIDGLRMACGG